MGDPISDDFLSLRHGVFRGNNKPARPELPRAQQFTRSLNFSPRQIYTAPDEENTHAINRQRLTLARVVRVRLFG